MSETIQESGIKGFLKWLQKEQPGVYARVAPEIAKKMPAAFSDFHGGGWRTAGLSHSQAVQKLNGLGSGLTDTFMSMIPSVESLNLQMPTVDIADAANAGGASSSLTDTIGSIVSGISALYLTKQQADIQQQVVNTQLQRAAAGLPPLPQSLSQLGVPQVSVGLSGGTGTALAVGAGVVGLLFLFGMLGKRRS